MNTDKEKKIRVGKFMVSTDVNGPGRRFVIWFQGCPFRCRGCFNPEFWDTEGGTLISIEEIMNQLNSVKEIEGVTFTGGEPLLQTEALLPLAECIKLQGLSIVCYTGYLLDDIYKGKVPYAMELLMLVDILIDGQFVEEERSPLIWRGSKNQKVYFLTDKYKYLEQLVSKEGNREVELQIGKNGLTITGFFEIPIWERLKERIHKER